MSTPFTSVIIHGNILRNALLSLWLMWLLTFVITRIYIFHESYVAENGKRADEKWLLEKCTEPEFYSNMRQHTDLCTEVSNNARTNLLLRALYTTMNSSTHLCGTISCTSMVYSMCAKFGWHITFAVALLLIVAPNAVFMFLHRLNNSQIASREQALQQYSYDMSAQVYQYDLINKGNSRGHHRHNHHTNVYYRPLNDDVYDGNCDELKCNDQWTKKIV